MLLCFSRYPMSHGEEMRPGNLSSKSWSIIVGVVSNLGSGVKSKQPMALAEKKRENATEATGWNGFYASWGVEEGRKNQFETNTQKKRKLRGKLGGCQHLSRYSFGNQTADE